MLTSADSVNWDNDAFYQYYDHGPLARTDGNRISKTVIKTGSTDTARTWYVRDATGNVMSVYESGKPALHDGRLTQSELHLYGSSRVGLLRRSIDVASAYNPVDTVMPLLGTGLSVNFGRGDKLFELSNHLGNVLVTLNDKKIGVSSGSSSLIDHYEPQVVSAQDYYPFGMLQPGRSYNAGGYRYGFNGKENDNEVKGEGEEQDYGMRVYDPRLGRFLSVDPLQMKYAWYTPYQFAGNKPIKCIDVDGLEDGLEVRTRRMEEGYLSGKVTEKQLKSFYAANAFGAVMGVGIVLTQGAILRYSPQLYTWGVATAVWLNNPSNVQTLQNTAGFVLSILNPDPNNTGVDFPGEGDEFGKTINMALQTRLGKLVQFFGEKGAKFANKSEWIWTQKLLAEGKNVAMFKESTKEGVKTADLFVDGIKTEIKEIRDVVVSSKMGDRIKETMEGAIKQVGTNGSILIDVSNQKGATKEFMLGTIERLKGKAKEAFSYRVFGSDFELTGTITPKK